MTPEQCRAIATDMAPLSIFSTTDLMTALLTLNCLECSDDEKRRLFKLSVTLAAGCTMSVSHVAHEIRLASSRRVDRHTRRRGQRHF